MNTARRTPACRHLPGQPAQYTRSTPLALDPSYVLSTSEIVLNVLARKVEDMNPEELNQLLSELLQLEIDSIQAYAQVIPHIDDPVMKTRLNTFRESHQKHVDELIAAYPDNHTPEKTSQDFKGYIQEGMAALRSMGGTKSALKALQSTEERVNRLYSEAVSRQAPGGAHDLFRKHFSDVKIHLNYITSNLEALP